MTEEEAPLAPDVVEQQSQQSAYEKLIEQQRGQAPLRTSLHLAGELEPAKAQEIINLSTQSGLPRSVVQNAYDQVKQQATNPREQEYRDLIERAPKTAAWLEDRFNAAATRNDREKLIKLEGMIRQHELEGPLYRPLSTEELGRQIMLGGQRRWEQLVSEEGKTFNTEEGPVTNLTRTPEEREVLKAQLLAEEAHVRSEENEFIASDKKLGFVDTITGKPMAGVPFIGQIFDLADAAEKRLREERGTPEDVDLLIRAARLEAAAQRRGTSFGGKAAAFLTGMTSFIPELALTGGVGAGVRAAIAKGATGLGLRAIAGKGAEILAQTAISQGIKIGANTYVLGGPESHVTQDDKGEMQLELVGDKGGTMVVPFFKAMGMSLVDVASAHIPLNPIYKFWAKNAVNPTVEKFLVKLAKDGTKGVLSGIAINDATKLAKEVIQGGFGAAQTPDSVKALTGDTEALQNIGVQAGGFALMGAFHTTLEHLRAQAEVIHGQAISYKGWFKEAAETVKSMETHGTHPEIIQDALTHQFEGTTAGYTFVPAHLFNDVFEKKGAGTATTFAEELTGKPDALREALKNPNGKIQVPTAVWLTKVATTPEGSFFQGHTSLDPRVPPEPTAKARIEAIDKLQETERKAREELKQAKAEKKAATQGDLDQAKKRIAEIDEKLNGAVAHNQALSFHDVFTEGAAGSAVNQQATALEGERASLRAKVNAAEKPTEGTFAEHIAKQAEAIGKTKEQASAFGKLLESGLQMLGLRGKKTMQQMVEKYGPVIEGGTKQPGPSLEQPAFHGSPHKFEQFDMSKIGSGEGNQAYGWGLYFAGEKAVAKSYRDYLTQTIPGASQGGSNWQVEGAEFPRGRSGHAAMDTGQDITSLLYYRKHGHEGMEQVVRENIERRIAYWKERTGGEGSAHDDMKALVEFYEKHVKNAKPEQISESGGRLFTVDIPEDADYLNWDKPIQEQTPKVREALAKLGYDGYYGIQVTGENKNERLISYSREEANAIMKREKAAGNDVKLYDDFGMFSDRFTITGEQIYRDLQNRLGSDKKASLALRAVGLPGIRYADAGSRNLKVHDIGTAGEKFYAYPKHEASQGFNTKDMSPFFDTREEAEAWKVSHDERGTSNYVLFDDRLVKTLSYEQPAGNAEGGYKRAGDRVSGLLVRDTVPNTDSIEASLENFKVLPGIREIPISDFSAEKPVYYSVSEERRTKELARQIAESKEINPLIVVEDSSGKGPYILEGSHRFDALKELGFSSFPALVVRDLTNLRLESPAFKSWFSNSKVVDVKGEPRVVYHGSQRPDRIGTRFRKSRATSGPMAFFTEDPEIGGKYATGKQDTSLEQPETYDKWFTFKPKGSRTPVSIDRAWFYLSREEQEKIAALAPRVTQNDQGNTILGPEGESRGLGGYDQHIKEARGNHLKALVEEWLSSGALFNDEEKFLKVLDLAGFKGAKLEDPNATYPSVFPVFLNIKKPLDTSAIPPQVIDALEQRANKIRKKPETYGADLWDKKTRDAKEWIATLKEDVAKGENSHAWSSIPDWVTETLKSFGYDGIKDTGGKLGGPGHTVWVPFEETQIKSAIGNRGTFDPNDPNILHQPGEGQPRGEYVPREITGNQPIIRAFQSSDPSTLGHEPGHLFLDILADLSQGPEPDQFESGHNVSLKQDFQTFLDWRGIKDAETWQKMTLDEKRPHHEAWAETYEQWLWKGKAPSLKLQGVFDRFRKWLSMVYSAIKGKGIEIPPEIEAVFQRIHATDAEIQAANARAERGAPFDGAPGIVMSPKDARDFAALRADASQAAISKLDAEAAEKFKKHQATSFKAARDTIQKEVTAELDQRDDIKALAFLKDGTNPDGSPLPENTPKFKLSEDAIREDYPGMDLSSFPKGVLDKPYPEGSGINPELAAQGLNFASGDELVSAIINLDRDRAIQIETDARVAQELQPPVEQFPEEAFKAIHNDQQAKLDQYELKWVLQNRPTQFKRLLDKIDAGVFIKEHRDYAKAKIADQTDRETDPRQHEDDEKQSRRSAKEALWKGDFDGYAAFKERAILNAELFRAASEARDKAQKAAKYVASFQETDRRAMLGRAGKEFRDVVDGINEKYEFTNVPPAVLASRVMLQEFIAQTIKDGRDLGEHLYAPEFMLEQATRKNWRDLKYSQLFEVQDVVKQIETWARLNNKMVSLNKQIHMDQVRREFIAQVASEYEELPPESSRSAKGLREKLKDFGRGADAALIKMEQMVRDIDGGKIDGPAHRYLWFGAVDAEAREMDMHQKVTAELIRGIEALPKDVREKLREEISLPGRRKITRLDLLGYAAQAGNASNWSKFLRGEAMRNGGFTPEEINSFLHSLSKEEKDLVQHLWDVNESLWPEIAKLYEELRGIAPEHIEAAPQHSAFTGYRGGYMPVIYEPSTKQGEMQLGDMIGDITTPGYKSATSANGFTKTRADGFAAPMDTDLLHLPNHIASVIKDLTHRKWMLDMNKILGDEEIAKAIKGRMGEEYYNRMREVVKQVMNDRNQASLPSLATFRRLLNTARLNVAAVAIGFKAGTLLHHITSIEGGIGELGIGYMRQGYAKFIQHPFDSSKEAMEISGLMRHFMETMDRDVKDINDRILGRTDFISKSQRAAMMAIGMANMSRAVPIFWAAHAKAMETLPAHMTGEVRAEYAVRSAEEAVRLIVGAGAAKDRAAVMSPGNDFLKAFTMFYTPGSVLYNRLRDAGHKLARGRDVPETIAMVIWTGVVAGMTQSLLAGHTPDKEKDETWPGWAAKKLAMYPMSTVPILREAAEALINHHVSSSGNPVMRDAEQLVRVMHAWSSDGMTPGGAVEETARTANWFVGLPIDQLFSTGDYLYDLSHGEASPNDFWQFWHDLLNYHRKRH